MAARALVAAGVVGLGTGVRLAAGARAGRVLSQGAAVDARARPPAPVRRVLVRRVPLKTRFRRRVGIGFGGRVFRATTFTRRPFAP